MIDFQTIKNKTKPELLAKLNRIKRFLDEGHAAVMVGSGFSKNADMDSTVKMKDWRELINDIYAEVYANEPKDEDLVLQSPMKMASLVEASCGRDALDAIIKRSLPDERVRPGKLHDMLMRLRWKDVFTTNYDTLLERAAQETDRYYQVVINKDDLLYQTSPRIIKLHGSFPHQHPFIMSEEDFRIYPVTYPEYINTVRQALIENLFCLIGFSGDDPNFLNWLGWLRDVMGDKVSPVYSITWRKNPLPEPEVNLFKKRKIEMVNLGEIDGLNGYKEAFEFFFSYLAERPKEEEWSAGPIRNKLYMDYRTDLLTQKLRKIRESYPGWLLLPKGYHQQFNDAVWGLVKVEQQIGNEDIHKQIAYLYELDWRLGISLTPKTTSEYVSALESVISSNEPLVEDEPEKLFSLANSLLSIYRYKNTVEKFDTLVNQIQSRFNAVYSQQYKRFYYEQCLMALWQLDYEKLNQLLDEWHVTNDDFEPVLWKSMLLYEAGRIDEAIQLLSKAHNIISQLILKEGQSAAYIKSCMLQIEKSLNYYQLLSNPLIGSKLSSDAEHRYRFDFWEIRGQILAEFNSNKGWTDRKVTHDFNIGRTNTNWNSGPGFAPNYLYPFSLLSLHEQAGVPVSGSATVFGEMLPNMCEYSFWIPSTIVLMSGNEALLKKVVSRTLLRTMHREDMNKVFDMVMDAYRKNSNSKNSRIREKLSNSYIPFAVRMSVNVSLDRVMSLTKLMLTFQETYSKNYLRTLYNCLDDNSVIEAVSELYKTPVGDWRDELPSIFVNQFSFPQDVFDITIASLFDDNHHVVYNAYHRLSTYYHKLSEDQRNQVDVAIRKWRNQGEELFIKLESYAFTKYDEATEAVDASVLGNSKAAELCSQPFVWSHDSSSFVELRRNLQVIQYLYDYISEEHRQNVLQYFIDFLEKNKDILKRDDSDEVLGGFRSFSNPLMDVISRFFMKVSEQCEAKTLNSLFALMQEYESYGFHLLHAIITIGLKLNLNSDEFKPISLVMSKLFTEKNSDALEAMSAIGHLKPDQISESDLQKMCSYLEYARRYHCKYMVYAMAVMAINNVMPENGYKYAVKALGLIGENFNTYNADDDEKSDIVYECLQLAGILYEMNSELREEQAIRDWKELADDVETFNDQKKGFEIGRLIAKN